MIPAPGRQWQVDLCEFKSSLVYRVSPMIARTIQKSTKQKKNNNNKKTTCY